MCFISYEDDPVFLIEKALAGGRRYWLWLGVLAVLMLMALLDWIREQQAGLGITGLSRDLPWGLYIGQFVFFVGLGASAIVVVLPFYLHDWKAFGKITILGEILGMVAVFMAMLFIFVSMGQPMRLLNVLRYPHPNSLIFWDLLVLSGYVVLNAVISVTLLMAEREEVSPPRWIKPLILLSLPWAVSIHTVTAFLLCGLVARPYWMTALLAPRFLASAFTSGSALLILILVLLRRLKVFDAGNEVVRRLTTIAAYCLVVHIFFDLVEAFTTFYGGIPQDLGHFDYLYGGLGGDGFFAPWMWLSVVLAVAAMLVLVVPALRAKPQLLLFACAAAFISIWLDKGFGLMVGGFEPSSLGAVATYVPTLPEWKMVAGIWAAGAFLITVFYKIAFAVRREVES
jgi:[DsrC]-trisulfide reductase subunit P